MKFLSTILSLLSAANIFAQQAEEQQLITTMKKFHQDMVNKNTASLDQQADKALRYGHSNGWIQTKKNFIKDLESGVISFNKISEDNIVVSLTGNTAKIKFNANIDAVVNGNGVNNKRTVTEVWVKKNKQWLLLSRQAVRV